MISPFIIFFVLLLVSAFFSGSETVIFSLSRTQIRKFQESKIWVVQRIGSYLEEPRKLLVTVLLGNELCNVAISIVGAALVSHFFPYDNKTQLLLAVAMVTPNIMILIKLIPKNIALSLADSLAPVVVPPIRLLHVLISPIR